MKKKTSFKVIIRVIIIVVLLYAIGNCDYNDYPSKKSSETWTILVYLCGTDLETFEGCATYNIQEMLECDIGDKVNVIIETGGAYEWQNDIIDPNHSQRYIIKDNSLVLLEEEPIKNMGEASTLSDFINYGIKTFEADNYGLVLWNHGGGSLEGVAYDEVYENDSLKLNEVQEAMESSIIPRNKKFEFVGYDCCLMATLENASAMENYANYMIASEEYEPGTGWDYEEWLEYLGDNTGASGKDLGQVICESYYDKSAEYGVEDMATISVVDLSKVETLKNSVDDLSTVLTSAIEDESKYAKVSKAASATELYGGNTKEEGYSNFIDLGNLMENLQTNLKENKYTKEVIDSLQNAVVYKKNGSMRRDSNGLSIYYPITMYSDEIDKYSEVYATNNYYYFVESIYDKIEAHNEESSVKVVKEAYVNEDNCLELDIEPSCFDYIDTIGYSLYTDANDGSDRLLYLGFDTDLGIDYDSGKIKDNFRGVWPSIEGQLLNLDVIEETDKYILYTAPIMLNDEETNLRVAWYWKGDNGDGYYKIIGTWNGIDRSGKSSRRVEKLKEGDRIALINYYYDNETDEYVEEVGEEFTVTSEEPKVKEIDLQAGNYYYCFEIYDVYGGAYISDYGLFTIDTNGQISIINETI